jgi:hypothetical protein
MRPIDWDDDPSFPSRHEIQVFNVSPNSRATVRFLGQAQGVWTHWLKQGRSERSAPHYKTDCPHCKADKKRWKGYVPSLIWRSGAESTWLPIVCELTQRAFNELKRQTDVTELRGKVVEVYRGKTSSGMSCKWIEKATRDLNYLPEAFNVIPILEQLWGMSEAANRSEHVYEDVPPMKAIPVKLPPPLPPQDVLPPPVGGRIKLGDLFKMPNGGAK